MVDKGLIKSIKNDFFSLRNGMVTDRLRKAGSPYKIIFGLLIPQIEQIAARLEPSADLAEWLWDNVSTRESRLLAVMVYPQDEFVIDMAEKWSAESDTVELTDVLCFRLVRNVPDAWRLVVEKADSPDENIRYFSFRLGMNLLITGKVNDNELLYRKAKAEYAKNIVKTKSVALQIIEEIDFMNDK